MSEAIEFETPLSNVFQVVVFGFGYGYVESEGDSFGWHRNRSPIRYENETVVFDQASMRIREPYLFRLDGESMLAIKNTDGTLYVYAFAE